MNQWICLLCLPMLFLVSCQKREVTSALKIYNPGANAQKIAILPFENLTPNTKAGEDFASFCYNSLFETLYREYKGKLGGTEFSLMDPQELRTLMEKNKWIDQSHYMDIGMEKFLEMLDCDLILLGKVSEYHYKRGLGEDPVASLHLRLYQRKSKTVIWSGSHSLVGRFSWFREDSLGRLAGQVAQEICDQLCFDIDQIDKQEEEKKVKPLVIKKKEDNKVKK